MRTAAITGLLLALTQTPHSGAPPMPYIDQGACPFECCTYRDWVAEAGFQAVEFWMADGG